MNNLIMNSCWCPGPGGGPAYFSGAVATFDDFCIDDNRTCSITQTADMQGYDQYDPLLPITGGRRIRWGYIMRKIEGPHILLQARFYSASGAVLDTQQEDIGCKVTAKFQRQMATFTAPRGAAKVQLSLHFAGKVTACTFYAPMAYYC